MTTDLIHNLSHTSPTARTIRNKWSVDESRVAHDEGIEA
jgi:hypothetical protein